jgi:ketosteroid isomerase-like protein
MSAVDDLDQLLEQWHPASDEFLKGNPKPTQELFSHREDVSLANPLGPAAPGIGPVAHGWEEVSKTQEHATSQFTDGQLLSIEMVEKYVSAELACVVHIERAKAKIGAREEITPFTLRATTIFRPEEGIWKVVHRHAEKGPKSLGCSLGRYGTSAAKRLSSIS